MKHLPLDFMPKSIVLAEIKLFLAVAEETHKHEIYTIGQSVRSGLNLAASED